MAKIDLSQVRHELMVANCIAGYINDRYRYSYFGQEIPKTLVSPKMADCIFFERNEITFRYGLYLSVTLYLYNNQRSDYYGYKPVLIGATIRFQNPPPEDGRSNKCDNVDIEEEWGVKQLLEVKKFYPFKYWVKDPLTIEGWVCVFGHPVSGDGYVVADPLDDSYDDGYIIVAKFPYGPFIDGQYEVARQCAKDFLGLT